MDTIICPICGREMVVDTIAEKTERSTFGDYRCGVKDMLVDTERDIFMKCECNAKLEFTLSERTLSEVNINSNKLTIEKAREAWTKEK